MGNITHQTHPSAEQLAAYAHGTLSESDDKAIEEHLCQCEACCRTLDALPDDRIVALLRSSDPVTLGEMPARGTAETAPPAALLTDEQATTPPQDSATKAVVPQQPAEIPGLPPGLAKHPRYRVVELLGSGGMGHVYKAEHRVMHRSVAIKLINREWVDHPEAVERFRREVQAAAKLSHPNVVTAYDAEQAGDAHFLAMEYVDGIDLRKVIETRGELQVGEACDYVRQAAVGLQHAFESGMIHRDIKPHNLMLTESGQIKILDFGLARFVTETSPETVWGGSSSDGETGAPQLTTPGTVMGTPDYLAPEQADDPHSADIRADIYSLGCTLHMLLTGQAPFHDAASGDKAAAHTEQQAPLIARFRTDVPSELETVVRRMIAKAPKDRYQTPAEVVEALSPYVAPNKVEATPVSTSKVAVPRITVWRWGLTATAVLLVLITAAIVILNRKLPPDPNKILEVRRFNGHTGKVDCLTFSRTGESLMSCGGRSEHRMRQWDVARGRLTRVSVGMDDVVCEIAALPDEQRVITSQVSGTVTLRDVATWEVVRQYQGHTHSIRAAAVSPDGELLLTGSQDGTVRLFTIETAEQIRMFEEGRSYAVAMSPDGRIAAHAWGARVHIWAVEDGATVARIDRRGAVCGALAFSPDGRLLAYSDYGGGTQVFDARSGREIRAFPRCSGRIWSIAFLHDGNHIVVGSQDKTLRIFEVATGLEAFRVDCDTYCTNNLAISPDGRHVATAGGFWHEGTRPLQGEDFAVHLWRLPERVWPKRDEGKSKTL